MLIKEDSDTLRLGIEQWRLLMARHMHDMRKRSVEEEDIFCFLSSVFDTGEVKRHLQASLCVLHNSLCTELKQTISCRLEGQGAGHATDDAPRPSRPKAGFVVCTEDHAHQR